MTGQTDQTAGPCILIPVFNDWAALALLLTALDDVLASHRLTMHVLVIDDASTNPRPISIGLGPFRAIHCITVLRVRRNLGHQRAIAIGLTYAYVRTSHDPIVVMDGDGEDDPADVPRLLERYTAEGATRIVFAQRLKRSESLVFRAGYVGYRWLHRILTGRTVSVGNFSVVPRSLLRALVVVSELWNHYAAAVVRARLPSTSIPTTRAKRLGGRSTMNIPALVVHGVSAMSVFSETIAVRLLAGAAVLTIVAGVGLAGAVALRFFSGVEGLLWIAGAGLAVVVTFNAMMLALIFTLTALLGRQNVGFIPERDYEWFVMDAADIYPRAADPASR